jgi:4-coumarate--CoA ligase
MPSKSIWPWKPLHKSIPSFLFDSPSAILPSLKAITIDPQHPETHFFTLNTLREWSKRFAAGLVAAGLEPGDRVMLFSGNDLFTPVVVLGTIMANGIYNSANPAYTPRELAHQLKDCEPKFILAADNCLDHAWEAVDLAGFSRDRVYLFESLHNSNRSRAENHWQKLMSNPQVAEDFRWAELDTPELSSRTAVLVYSSGTTGLPKGVELSHFNLVSNALQLLQVQFTTDNSLRRALCCIPMYHGLGLVYYTIVAPKAGMQVFLMERYKLPEMLDYLQRFKITELLLVPPILLAMTKDPGVQRGDYNLDSIQKVVAGAAPIGMEVSQEFEKIWSGRVKVRQAWGMSEFVPPLKFDITS